MPNAAPSRVRRAVRIGVYVLGGVFALLVIALGAGLLVLRHLESPAIKQRIVAAAAQSGISLDYAEASVSLSTLHLTKLRLAQPPPDEKLEPLFAVERIDLTYSAWGALIGGRVKLKSGQIEGVRAVIFADENGESSITRLLARMPKDEAAPSPKKKPQPLSNTLAQLSNLAAEVHHFKLEQVSASLVERKAFAIVKQTDFSGVEITASEPQGVLDVRIASPEAGARVVVTEQEKSGEKKKEALADFHAELIWSARGKPPHGAFDLEAKLRHQDLIAMPPQAPAVKTLLSLHAGITPEPSQDRTRIVIEKLDLLEGAGSGHLDAELFDDGKGSVKPSIHEVILDLVLERFRPFIPTDQGTLEALSGSMSVRIFGIDLSKGLRIAADGGAEIKAEIPQLKWKQGSQSAEVTRAKLIFKAKPAAGGAVLELEMPIERVRLESGRQSFSLSHAEVKSQADATFSYRATGGLTAKLGSLKMVGAQTIDAEDTELRVALKDADLAAEGPLKISGGAGAELDFGHLLANVNGLSIDGLALKLRAPLKLDQDANGGSGEIHFEAQLSVKKAGKPLLVPTISSADLTLTRFQYDAADAPQSTADFTLAMALGAVQLNLHADKKPRDLDYELSAKAASLAIAKPFSNVHNDDGSEQIPWQQIGMTLASKGSIGNLGGGNALKITEETSLGITRGALHGDLLELGFAQLSATLKSHGTPMKHEADLTMQLSGLAVQNEARPGDENVSLHAAIDRETSNAKAQFAAKGEAAPEGNIDFAFGYDRAAARVTYAIEGELHRLDLVPIFLPPSVTAHTDLEWSTLGISLSGKGALTGVVTGLRDFKPKLAPNPIQTMRGAQSFELKLTGLDYSNDQDQSVVLSAAELHVDAREDDSSKHVELTASSPSGELDAANAQAKFEALLLESKIDLGKESLRAEMSMKLGSLKQDSQPAYPIGDASFDALITAGADGTVHIDHVTLDNVAGGTTMSASGVLEAMLQFTGGAPKLRPVNPGGNIEQKDLKMTGRLEQRLEAVPAALGFTGRGTMSIPFSAESNDFRYFRVTSGLEFKDADVELPARKIALRKLNAKIPVRLGFRLDDAGTIPLGGARPGVYSRERFVDYQPFLSSEDFLNCETLTFGDTVVGPLAANLRVDRNVIALDQLEMSAFGGKITGQFLLDLDLAEQKLSDVQFRGNVTGLAPGKGEERSAEVVDANAALRLNPKKLELEGRIDLIRIGRDDLRAMLDAWDPIHSDESANRTRQALIAGYPKDVRIGFHQGFTEVRMEMGGLAGLSKLDPIQLSTGPILQKYVAPYLKITKPKPPVEVSPAAKAQGTP